MTDKPKVIEFYTVRGAEVKDYGEYFAVLMRTTCQYLTPFGCKLHGTLMKPQVCMEYDCRQDKHLPRPIHVPYQYEGE